MDYMIDQEFKALIRSLTEAEYSALESSIQNEGCRDAIIVWRGCGIIVDGHNRYEICRKHGIEFRVEEKNFSDRQAVKVWILKNQLARRNLTDGERFEVAVLLKDALAEIGREKMSEARKEAWVEKKEGLLVNNKPSQSEPAKEEPKHDTQKDIAQAVGLTRSVVTRIINKDVQNEHEPTIKTSSAAEEIAALPKEKSLPMQEAPSPCGVLEPCYHASEKKGRYASSIRSEKCSAYSSGFKYSCAHLKASSLERGVIASPPPVALPWLRAY